MNEIIYLFGAAINDPYFFGILGFLSLFWLLWVFLSFRNGKPKLFNRGELPPEISKHSSEQRKPAVENKPSVALPSDSSTSTPTSPSSEVRVSAVVQEVKDTDADRWLNKLQLGLSRTRESLQGSLSRLFSSESIESSVLDQLHEILFRADIGVSTADKLVEAVKRSTPSSNPDWSSVRQTIYQEVLKIMEPSHMPLNPCNVPPRVILVVGVNGVGKTTSIGKLAAHFMANDQNVLLCAADTFRAAAIDQLKVWGERLGVPVVAQQQGSDPAAVAYDGVKAALSRKADVLLIDTAGRLHNKKDLMQELDKIRRVIGKDHPEAPHETWLVIDATTGQNAFQQVKAFDEVAKLTGIVVTKLDGTAKGGVIIGVTDQFRYPIRFIGVGEKASDLREFKARDYLDSLFPSPSGAM